MDEIWERAVETALDGQADHAAARILTLDGVVKCVQGRLPLPSLLEKFENLQHLSIANIGVSSLEQFPRLRNLEKLILSDNRIAGGLEFLVEAGLDSLRDLDLSNNRIQSIENLAPLAQLKLVSLDLYECPVTRVKDYRSRVFGLIKSLKYLDKMDAEENERPESDDEEEDEEEEEDDPGSGEIDGDDQHYRISNGHREGGEEIVDADEESDADEEETEISGRVNGLSHEGNGFRIEEVGRAEDEDGDDDYENGSGEEVDDDDEEEEEEEEDVVEVHDIGDSDDDEEDGVDDDEEEEDEEEEVDNDESDFAEPESTGRLTSTEGEIDGHEHGEDGDDDENGETGEEELGVGDDGEYEDEEEGEEEDDDYGEGYLVQPVVHAEEHAAEGSEMEPGNEEEDDEDEEEVEDDEDVQVLPSTSSQLKRKRSRRRRKMMLWSFQMQKNQRSMVR
ncbi:Acidic leucine-rich nuclear phosphoprotein 32-related protein [Hibiscus syriacus]|uniref:Acidic leucine-rich nuclear phosphoprotein 32-related protein n=1 Tax=Hibiscus syriacus TaxID=106335 RepID=A0A6A2WBR3_HIBSY|nr:Acidic leucine-rich nuclear phosphoprotein 32-related protein [Hibiscus syriacus]